MWLVVESLAGNRFEYWLNGKFIAALDCDATIEVMEELKRLLNGTKVRPAAQFVSRETGNPRCHSSI